MPNSELFGAVEAGGTKTLCALAGGPNDILVRTRIPTTTPDEVFGELRRFFQDAAEQHGNPASVGIATFGPVDIRDPKSPGYGAIMKTPKSGWEGANWCEAMNAIFSELSVVVETDVNAAALAEIRWGAAKGMEDVVYFTIGTGIGAGIIVNGKPAHGLLHPEVGHIRIPREAEEIARFEGVCPFHGDCLEGIASGPAMEARWGVPAEELPADHDAWNVEADAIAWACVNIICTVSPARIIIGGGVSQQDSFFPLLRKKVVARLNGYLDVEDIVAKIDQFIVPPVLGQDAGLLGALALVC